MVEGEDVTVTVAGEDGQGGLASVVGLEESVVGGGAAPVAADGAAAEDGFGVEADEDLPQVPKELQHHSYYLPSKIYDVLEWS